MMNNIKCIIIILLPFYVLISQAGIFSPKTTKRTLELENNKKEMKIIMKEIKNMSNKILEQWESLVKSNVTIYEVNAMLAILAGLLKGYGILQTFFDKGAAPLNSVGGNLNATNLTITQNQYKDNNYKTVIDTVHIHYNHYNQTEQKA